MTAFALRKARIDPRPGKLIDQLTEDIEVPPARKRGRHPSAGVLPVARAAMIFPRRTGVEASRDDSCHVPLLFKSRGDEEIIQLPATSKLRLEPSRHPAPPRPGLHRVVRIPILRTNGRVLAALTLKPSDFVSHSDPSQPFLQSGFFRQHCVAKFGGHLVVNFQKLVKREQLQMIDVHSSSPVLRALINQAQAADKARLIKRSHNPHLIAVTSSDKGERAVIA